MDFLILPDVAHQAHYKLLSGGEESISSQSAENRCLGLEAFSFSSTFAVYFLFGCLFLAVATVFGRGHLLFARQINAKELK